MDRTEKMRAIRDQVVDLKASPLYAFRVENAYHPVIGQGNHYARVMFIGEAPGESEAKTGRPFCGRSGKMLDELLNSIGMSREDVYITNIVKDRPPANRDPHQSEIDLYAPFLVEQINIIQPEVIATLGRFSMEFVLNLFHAPQAKGKISQLRGQRIPVETAYGKSLVVPLYHPAVGLYRGDQKATLFEDFKTLADFS
ncbi:type-4 uracil-DNA glycosylase [Anaerolineales bacterium]